MTVNRVHGDRDKVFTAAKFQQWLRTQAIHHTYTAGDDPKANGLAECAVGLIKWHARAVLEGAGDPHGRRPSSGRTPYGT